MTRLQKWFLVCCLFALCAACAPSAEPDDAEDFREFFAEKETLSMEAKVSADYGDRVYEFTLRYDYSKNGQSAVEILAPEPVSGIKAIIEAGQTTLTYDGVSLDTGTLPNTGLSPADALPAMLRAWIEGYVTSLGGEQLDDREVWHFVYSSTVADVPIEQHVWVEKDTFVPLRAEMIADGTRIIDVTFTGVTF